MTNTLVENEVSLDNLFLHGVLFDLTIKSWQARKNAKSYLKELGISQEAWDDDVLTGSQIKFISDKVRKQFAQFDSNARICLYRNSLPFMNTRFVPYTAVQTLLNGDKDNDGLEQIKSKFDHSVSQFLDDFEDLREKYLSSHEKYRSILEEIYPSKIEVEKKFSFKWNMYEITVPKESESAMQETSIDNILADREVRNDLKTQIRQQLHEEAEEFVKDTKYILRDNIVKALENFNKVLKSGNGVKSNSFNAIRSAIDNFNQLNFIGDSDIDQKLSEFKSKINGYDNIKKSDQSTAHLLSSSTESILKAAQSAFTKTNSFGNTLRSID